MIDWTIWDFLSFCCIAFAGLIWALMEQVFHLEWIYLIDPDGFEFVRFFSKAATIGGVCLFLVSILARGLWS